MAFNHYVLGKNVAANSMSLGLVVTFFNYIC